MRWQGACSGLDGRRCAGPSHGARHAAASPRKRGEVRAAAKCDRPLTGEGRRKGTAPSATGLLQGGRQARGVIMTTPELELDLRASIRTIPDYPSPGIMFRDITTLLGNARAFRRAVDELVQPWAGYKIDKVAGIEARGFILGGAVAHQCSAGFVPIRKKGKLPYKRVSIGYSLEYGVDEMEMHEDGVAMGERVVLVDDLVATGGSADADLFRRALTSPTPETAPPSGSAPPTPRCRA